ncbi:hypothetical protein ACJJIF_09900 [Microbulbifer sp. SSSA002]|uniref:hypothetical protein n=1 Tax=unclassified Microbulbifer TaxID=2619833 RepID=UPI004039864C
MSGKKNKHKHRRQEHKKSSEFLDELNSLHTLLVSDENSEDIPVLSQVAKQGDPVIPEPPALPSIADTAKPSGTPATSEFEDIDISLEDIDLPILFSPVEEEMLAQQSMSLAESDLALLRPLQELTAEEDEALALAEIEAVQEAVEVPAEDSPSLNSTENYSAAQPEQEPEPSPQATAEQPSAEQKQVEVPAEESSPLSSSAENRSAAEPEQKPEPQAQAAAEQRQVEIPVEKKPALSRAESGSSAEPNRKPAPKPRGRTENPFLPDHIRARLTGGRPLPNKTDTGIASTVQPKTEAPGAGEKTATANSQLQPHKGLPSAAPELSAKERQRQDLIEQLVAQQLPKLERRLRAQIEQVVDELGVWD